MANWDDEVIDGFPRAVLLEGIERWKKTGYGIDLNQLAFRHYGNDRCPCHVCAGTPIAGTLPPPQYRSYVGQLAR
jgi:hypothetical protein